MDHLFHDSDSLCRAWSASSFLQMAGRNVSAEKLQAECRTAFIQCLETESDLFVKGVLILSIQDIYGKRLGLSQSSVDEKKEKSILNATRRALAFLCQK